MKNQEHNNNLDELFNKAKANKQSLDDFEKDAFAGFEMLDSEQEAKDLKAALDTRINNELFKKEEKNNPKIYWLAAAGLALVIGLTVMFVSNSNEAISSGSNLAISNVEEKSEEKTLPDSKAELKEQNLAPVEMEASSTDQSPAKEPIELKVAEFKNDEPTKGVKTRQKEEVTSRMIVSAAKSETPKDGLFEGEKDKKEADQNERRKENAMGTGSNTSGGYLKDVDDLAKKDKAKEKTNDDQNFAATTKSTPQQNKQQASEDAELNVQDELASNEAGKKGKADGKAKNAELEQDYKTPIVANNNTNSSSIKENSKSKSSRSKAKKSSEKSSMAGPENLDNYPGTSPKTTTPEIAGEVNAVPAEAETKALSAAFTNCYYTGGEVALTKDIKDKLKGGDLDQKFDAMLYINEKKAVEKVEFTNAYDLTAKQKEEVTKILKTLTKFNVTATGGKRESFAYKLLYRP